jgi:hypothetical protein
MAFISLSAVIFTSGLPVALLQLSANQKHLPLVEGITWLLLPTFL